MTNLIISAICVATNSFIMPTNAAIRPTWRTISSWGITVTNRVRHFYMSASDIAELRLQSGGRMSEITETVAVVTNVVPADNERGCSTCDMLERAAKSGNVPAIWHPPHGAEPYTPATERTETTTVTERRTLRFRWSGEWRELTTERVMGEPKVRRWVRREQWEEAKGGCF